MKRILICRHGKAASKKGGTPDIERPLKKRGISDASRMAERLDESGLRPDRVISSPARRAMMTAEAMAEQWEWNKEEIITDGVLYPGDPEEIIPWIAELPDDADCVLIVGHLPGLEYLVDLLTDIAPGHLPTASVANCQFHVEEWAAVVRGTGSLATIFEARRE